MDIVTAWEEKGAATGASIGAERVGLTHRTSQPDPENPVPEEVLTKFQLAGHKPYQQYAHALWSALHEPDAALIVIGKITKRTTYASFVALETKKPRFLCPFPRGGLSSGHSHFEEFIEEHHPGQLVITGNREIHNPGIELYTIELIETLR